MSIWFLLLVLVVALVFFFAALARQRLLTARPTSKLGSAPSGYTELQGMSIASPESDLLDPIENRRCLWFRVETFRQEQHVRRDGRTGRERVRSVWVKIDEAESSRPFLFEDGTGRCLIAPAGASIEVPRSTVYSGNRFFGRGIRHYIWRIHPSETLFVLGQLHCRDHNGERQLRLEKPHDNSTFLITDKSEQEMLRTGKLMQVGSGIVAFICTVALIPATLAMFRSPPSAFSTYAEAVAPRIEPSPVQQPTTAARTVPRSEDLLVEQPKTRSSLSESERFIFERRQRWIDQLRANQAYAGFDTAPPMLSVIDRGETVLVTNNSTRDLSLHLGRLTNWSNPDSRLCVLRAPRSGADGATRLKPKEKTTFNLPADCPTRGSLDYRIGSHEDLDSTDAIGWWSKSAIDREAKALRQTVGS